jgi:glycogen phosphorylase
MDKRQALTDPCERERTRTGMSADSLKRAFLDNIFYLQGRPWQTATMHDKYMAGAYTIRDRILHRWVKSTDTYREQAVRTVCYFSAEFLPGPHLANNILNLGVTEAVQQAAEELQVDAWQIIDQEVEPGLGNGGLGRLAACYLDSLATLQIPTIGYGIRYEFGIFEQVIVDGWQKERSDLWLRNGNPWEVHRTELRYPVKFGGRSEHFTDDHGRLRVNWIPDLVVDGVACDTPIAGFGVCNTNLLRLWCAQAASSFDFEAFNTGDYYRAVEAKVVAENISKVLYPNNEPDAGKELRLKQQYFFVSCSLQDMLRLHFRYGNGIDGFQDKFVIQLNDTHPAIAVPELMRLLVDEHGVEWERAWDITSRIFAYTNHTLLPEALETWSVKILGRLLPRHLEIIYEINQRFLDDVRIRYILEEDRGRIARLSLISGEGSSAVVHMANLAAVGSFAINGVAELHTELLKSTVMKEFSELWPEKFHNITNGVTPRRFMCLSNPGLAELITRTIGSRWITHLEDLHQLEDHVGDANFRAEWRAVKLEAKKRLAGRIKERTGILVDPESLFDVQVKRIHEYKRQHLNVLNIVTLYERIKRNPNIEMTPRTFVFGGKAAPGYYMAKLIIKLINAVADAINRDPQINHLLRVVFYPDFNVKNGQLIYPAADLSEQISTAGKEASGTGNMKFAMNGALTIGTLDGANVEIREEVGDENFFLFGLTVDEVARTWSEGYRPWEIYQGNDELRAAIDLINSGAFSHGDTGLFRPLTDALLKYDTYLVLADYQAYVECQTSVDHAYRDVDRWTRMSIFNVARIGKFSSDRSIQEYCDKIWRAKPVPVVL